jgi:hypothetical protein
LLAGGAGGGGDARQVVPSVTTDVGVEVAEAEPTMFVLETVTEIVEPIISGVFSIHRELVEFPAITVSTPAFDRVHA